MLQIQPNIIKVAHGIEVRASRETNQTQKRCSIVLFTNSSCSDINSYLHSLSTTGLANQYELVIINNSQAEIDESYARSCLDDLKIIKSPAGLKFVQLCILAAQQAKGKYVIFSQCQIDENWLDKIIDELETRKASIAIPEEKNYILVDRMDFLEAGSFERFVAKQEGEPPLKEQQSYHYTLLAELNRYADVRDKNVLVVGCNRGLECNLLVRMGAKEVTGLDEMEEIGKNYPHPRTRYVRCSAEKMPFEDNSFDICCSMATLEHIPNPKAALEEMVRVTARRGVIYCQAAPLWNSAFGHHFKNTFPNEPWIHLRKKTADEMKSYYKGHHKETIQLCSVEGSIDYLYSKNFNRLGTQEYKSIVADLFRVTSPIHIEFGINYKDAELLTPSILSELKDYSEEELLTDGLKLILRKV
jgi:ubiquinone/menaquinone biosynthesis C-methylase UbiE